MGLLLARNQETQKNRSFEQHTARCSLKQLTGWIEGLTFAEVSAVVNISERELRKVLHDDGELNPESIDRIDRLTRLTRKLRTLMPAAAVGWWDKTSDPALNGQSPMEALALGRLADLEQVVESYFDPAYA